MVKIALVGAGFIGQTHANCYKKIENVDVVAVVDKVEEKGKKLAKELNASFYNHINELLDDKNIDCIDICVPTFLHSDMVVRVANAGKHVFCEKPLALSLKEADKMIKAVKTNNVKAMVGHALRFWPEYVRAKELVDSGELGKPLQCFCQRLAITPDWHQENWGLNEKYSGGVAIDLHIHDLDYLIWLFGKPSIIKAQGVYNPDIIKHGGLVHITTTIEFKNGAAGLAEGGWAFRGSFPFTMIFRILCESGTVEWIFRAGKNIEERFQEANLTVYRDDGSTDILEVKKKDAYLQELSYFVNCLKNNKPIENATFEDGKAALELALAAVKSAKEKSVVKL